MAIPSALPPDQRRALLQQRIAQRQAQWYEQHLLRLEAEAAHGPPLVSGAANGPDR